MKHEYPTDIKKRKEAVIKDAQALYPEIDKKVIEQLIGITQMYGGSNIACLSLDVYWSMVYGDEMVGKHKIN